MAEQLLCPGCGTPSHFDEFRKAANEFCRTCDYPLFWAKPATALRTDVDDGGDGFRRLPGVAGRVAIASRDCWSCREPNPVSAIVCVSCGADLSGPPIVVPTVVSVASPLPPPPPPPPPTKPAIWPWIVLAILFVAGLALLLVLI